MREPLNKKERTILRDVVKQIMESEDVDMEVIDKSHFPPAYFKGTGLKKINISISFNPKTK